MANTEHSMTTEKKKDDLNVDSVHSANKWENADLGDDSRKMKFLRLMGAGKKDHQGKIIIGDKEKQHERKKEDTEEINEDLEDQFIEALEHKKVSGFKGHSGLGFHQEAEKKEEQKEEKKEESAGSDDKTESKSESKDSKQEEQKVQKHKLEEQEETKDMTDPKKKKFMMNFVKSST